MVSVDVDKKLAFIEANLKQPQLTLDVAIIILESIVNFLKYIILN